METNSASLAQRMMAGDPSSYAEILDRCSEDVLRLGFLMLGDVDESRDVLQESMLRLIRTAREGRFDPSKGSIEGFVKTTARNLCIDRMKKRARFIAVDDPGDIAQEDESTPADAARDAQFEEAFERALEQLTHTQRAVMVLHESNDETPRRIAETLGLTVENVRMHLCRGRARMREMLEPFAEER